MGGQEETGARSKRMRQRAEASRKVRRSPLSKLSQVSLEKLVIGLEITEIFRLGFTVLSSKNQTSKQIEP